MGEHLARHPVRAFVRERVDRGAADARIASGVGMQRNEQVRVGPAGDLHPVLQRHEAIARTGQHHHITAVALQPALQRPGGGQSQVLLMHPRAHGAGILAAMAGVDDDDLAGMDGERSDLRELGRRRDGRKGWRADGGQVDHIAVGGHAVRRGQQEAADDGHRPGQRHLQLGRVALAVDVPGAHQPLPFAADRRGHVQALQLQAQLQQPGRGQAMALGGPAHLDDDAGLALVAAEADLDDRGGGRVPGRGAKARQRCTDREHTPEPDSDPFRQSPAHCSPKDQGLRRRSLNPLSTKARSETVK